MKNRSVLGLAALALVALVAVAAAGLYRWRSDEGRLHVVEYPVGEGRDTPVALAAGADGAVWFTLDSTDVLGVIRGGKVERVKRGVASVEPIGIGVDLAGSVWATDPTGVAVVHLDPRGQLHSIPLGTPIARLGRLATAPDGSVWFAEGTSYSFTQLSNGVLKRNTFDSARGGPYGVAIAPDGTVWGTLQSGNKLVRIAPDGSMKEFDIPTRSSAPTDVAVDRDSTVWFVQFRGNKIGRYRGEEFTEYPMPEGAAGLSGIAIGRDGCAWFGVLRGAALGRVCDGKVEIQRLPRDNARPYTLAADKEGNIWYADLAGYVGMVKPH
jgi:virginiamycin B lyase